VIQSVTSAPTSVADDQGTRIRRYLVTMGIRTACFLLAIVTSGAARWSFVVAAVLLPYIAVVMANAVGPRHGREVPMVSPTAPDAPALGAATPPGDPSGRLAR